MIGVVLLAWDCDRQCPTSWTATYHSPHLKVLVSHSFSVSSLALSSGTPVYRFELRLVFPRSVGVPLSIISPSFSYYRTFIALIVGLTPFTWRIYISLWIMGMILRLELFSVNEIQHLLILLPVDMKVNPIRQWGWNMWKRTRKHIAGTHVTDAKCTFINPTCSSTSEYHYSDSVAKCRDTIVISVSRSHTWNYRVQGHGIWANSAIFSK